MIDMIPTLDKNILIKLKCRSFFEREKLDKEYKDACDIYALLIYGNTKINSIEQRKAVEKIISRSDICDFIAENVLRDPLKGSYVKTILGNILEK